MVTEAAVKVNMWKFASLQQMDDNLHSISYVGVKQYGTIRINAILHIVFKCIEMYCHIAICDWIMIFLMGLWVIVVKNRIYTLLNHINYKKLTEVCYQSY